MSIEGIVSSSVIFHDKDGTTTLKIGSLSSSESYADGKMAVITGTCSDSAATIDLKSTGYMMADGTTVGWSSASTQVRKIAFSATPEARMTGNSFLGDLKLSSSNNAVSMTEVPYFSAGSGGVIDYTLSVQAPGAFGGTPTATYTVIIVGD